MINFVSFRVTYIRNVGFNFCRYFVSNFYRVVIVLVQVHVLLSLLLKTRDFNVP